MKVLLCHNFYQQRGGEDEVYEAEAALLETHGHEVLRHCVHNDAVRSGNLAAVGLRSIWNRRECKELAELIAREKPNVAHFHNTFPLLSPAVYRAAAHSFVPVVKTIHNYRPLCIAATLHRNGSHCEDCLGKAVGWPGVAHGCYRGSRLQSLAPVLMNATHRLLGTWREKVDLYLLAGTARMRERYAAAGFPPSKLVLKPNFVWPDPGPGPGDGGYALFVGRLERDKGVSDLLAAWSGPVTLPRLKIVGEGPLLQTCLRSAAAAGAIEVLGRQPLRHCLELMKRASFLVFPSRMAEGMPRTIIEAFACGTPVLASAQGAMLDLVSEGRTGMLFRPGEPRNLADRAAELHQRRELATGMRIGARREFEQHYTAQRNHELLMDAYARAAANC